MFDDPAVSALATLAIAGFVLGLVGGVLAGAKRLIGAMLMGAIGAVAAAAIAKAAGADPLYSAGQGFSYVYGAIGALVLSYVVGRNDRAS